MAISNSLNDLILVEVLRERCKDIAGPIPNGARIEKCDSVYSQDTHQDGDRGRVLFCVGCSLGQWGYIIEWDDMPAVPVGIIGRRLRVLEER